MTHEVRAARKDAASARVLAGGADRDVTELRGEIRDFRQATTASFNAMREDLSDLSHRVGGVEQRLGNVEQRVGTLEQRVDDGFTKMDNGFMEMRGGFDAVAAGFERIAMLIERHETEHHGAEGE